MLGNKHSIHFAETSQLRVAYYAIGSVDGWPCIMSHGFPYDPHCYADCITPLVDAGAYVIVPYLRGYGPTTFLSKSTLRSGEQAALAQDLLDLMDCLSIDRALLAGFDWGGRAGCIVSALYPDRVSGLVSGGSYNIQNIARSAEPSSAQEEMAFWYQYYFHSERGYRGLNANRRDLTRLLWKMWSPTWDFSDEDFERTAAAFDNEDFVDVVIHSYRHRYALVPGDSAVAALEKSLHCEPKITVPCITIDGEVDGVGPSTAHHSSYFTGQHQHRVFNNVGHNLPQEAPEEWVDAILAVRELDL